MMNLRQQYKLNRKPALDTKIHTHPNTVVKAYFGTTENAVRSQVWIALIATLLLQILFQRSRDHRYFSTFNWVVRQSLWKYIRLEQILNPSILGRDEPEASCEESPQMELPFGKVGP